MITPKESLGFLIADVARRMRRAFEERFEAGALTLAQARALVHVAHHEGIRQVQLASMLNVQPITLARLVDQLVDAGLVERRADPTDRRAYLIFLRRAAAPHLRRIEKVVATIREDALRDLDRAQIDTVFLALRKMRDNLSVQG
jgi:DNA-binding MarR family transcriptional regulator